MKHASPRGFIFSSEALISILIASSLLLLLPLTSSAEEARYSRLYHYQLLNDFFEVAAKDGELSSALSEWAGGSSSSELQPNFATYGDGELRRRTLTQTVTGEVRLQRQLDSLHNGLGLCIGLRLNGRFIKPSTCSEPSGDIVSTHRTIATKGAVISWERVDGLLWAG